MKIKKEKENKYTFNIEMVNKLHQYLETLFATYDKSQLKIPPKVLFIIRGIMECIIDSVVLEEVEIEREYRESEDEAKQYFGEEFIKKIEELRQRCKENGLSLMIHGTLTEYLEEIMKKGLCSKDNRLHYTAVTENFFGNEEYYTTLLNWPHRGHKGLVLLGIPKECLSYDATPIWLDHLKADDFFDLRYLLKPEFIIATIDVNKKRIEENPDFTIEHDYTGLIQDSDFQSFEDYFQNSDQDTSYVEYTEEEMQEEQPNAVDKPYQNVRNYQFEITGVLSNMREMLAGIRAMADRTFPIYSKKFQEILAEVRYIFEVLSDDFIEEILEDFMRNPYEYGDPENDLKKSPFSFSNGVIEDSIEISNSDVDNPTGTDIVGGDLDETGFSDEDWLVDDIEETQKIAKPRRRKSKLDVIFDDFGDFI